MFTTFKITKIFKIYHQYPSTNPLLKNMRTTLFKTSAVKQKNTLVAIQSKVKNYTGLDKYYTLEEVAKSCLEKLCFENYDFVIEPSAGNGSFYKNINHPNKIGLDIDPANPQIERQDWFKYQIPTVYKKVLIVGNPPFGINNHLSMRFLKHGFRFSNVRTIAFILPNVFNKHTKQKLIPTCFRISAIKPLGRNSFIYEAKPKHIPCSFFIFDRSKGEDLRFSPKQHLDTPDFYFGTKTDFDIFVFGASPRKVITNPKPNNRGYFLKSKIPIQELKSKIRNVNWRGNSSANGGVFWLTKPELCCEYKKFYNML